MSPASTAHLDLATHYRTAILPTRARKPRDKAKVEVAVLLVECWILAQLRNRRFFSLVELNQAIAELVADLNARPMRRLGVSRRDLFLELDRPALKELPAEPYQRALSIRRVADALSRARLPRRYRRALLLSAASADHEQLDARITERTIELFCKGERVAVHNAWHRSRAPHDDPRAHAERAPALCRVDDRAHWHRCGGDRSQHRQADGADP
jgi:hypothetical protein